MSLVARLTNRLRWLLRSSTLRLTLLVSLIFAIGMAVAIFVALDLGRKAVLERVDATLAGVAATVATDEADEELRDESSIIIRPLSQLNTLPRPFSRIVRRGDGRGTVHLDRDFRRSDAWRALVANDSQANPVLIALPIEDSDNTLELLGGVLWITTGLVVFFTLAIGLAAGIWARRRVVRINHTLDRLASGDLTARTGVERSGDDLDDLARQLDGTAKQLEQLVAQTRNLSASLAHDLRTPLARLRAQLEMLPLSEERGIAMEEAQRLSAIFDTIMRVARIEAGHGKEGFAPVDLAELMEELGETFEPVADMQDKQLKVLVDTKAREFADRGMLVQALANLIQNALVHGGPEITLFAHGREIGVSDNGAGVDPDQFSEIIKPMVRLDAARESEGTGLGLALVRAVADRHGAELNLSRNDPQGLRVSLKFTEL
jgi:signal transduction histidine kinase